MKSSTIKNIVVKLADDNIHEIKVDTDIFDDPFVEAATQAIERCKLKKFGIIRPVISCWEKRQSTKCRVLNSYWILVNASLGEKAELLREKFQIQNNIDLSKEPICGSIDKNEE